MLVAFLESSVKMHYSITHLFLMKNIKAVGLLVYGQITNPYFIWEWKKSPRWVLFAFLKNKTQQPGYKYHQGKYNCFGNICSEAGPLDESLSQTFSGEQHHLQNPQGWEGLAAMTAPLRADPVLLWKLPAAPQGLVWLGVAGAGKDALWGPPGHGSTALDTQLELVAMQAPLPASPKQLVPLCLIRHFLFPERN